MSRGTIRSKEANLSALAKDDLLGLCRHLYTTRLLEERLEGLVKQGRVVGGLYRSLGQEATAVGSASALAPGDWLAPSIRNLGALLVRGIQPHEILAQYTARSGSLTGGKDNTNHFTIPERGILGPISPLGTQLCVLNGVALSFKIRGSGRVCLTYQGEGATRTSASHEGFAMAAALQLPIVVVLEHNRWSFGTPSALQAAVDSWTDVAGAYGVPAVEVDGNDVLEVREATESAAARARSGNGLTIIVSQSYRMLGHAQHDAQRYVPQNELEAWRRRDPIRRFENYLIEFGYESEAGLEALRKEIAAELDAAVDEVLAEPYPDPETALTRVYGSSELDADPPWTRPKGRAMRQSELASRNGPASPLG